MKIRLMGSFIVAQLDEIAPVKCPCGLSRRAFLGDDKGAATVHLVDITEDARTHYHKKLTEIYIILQGSGFMELDGQSVPVKPFTAILVKPLCRHRAVGRLRIINICIPGFDQKDEWLD